MLNHEFITSFFSLWHISALKPLGSPWCRLMALTQSFLSCPDWVSHLKNAVYSRKYCSTQPSISLTITATYSFSCYLACSYKFNVRKLILNSNFIVNIKPVSALKTKIIICQHVIGALTETSLTFQVNFCKYITRDQM